MQVVSTDFRPTLYSGDAQHTAILTIGNITIDNENIKSIKVSNPIIDKTNDTFYIGTFVSKQVEIELFNADEIDLTGQIHLSIGTYIEALEDYEMLDIGYFNIETSPEDYYKNAKIVALDNAIKFKPNVDYSNAMDFKYYQTSDTTYQQDKEYYSLVNNEYVLLVVGTDYNVGDNITGTIYERTNAKLISCEDLLIWLCNHFGVTLGTYPNINKDIEISTYDSSVSGKQYISYIAEIMGGNAQIGRDGHLYIIPLKQVPSVQIDATEGKSWELKEKYEISAVKFLDAIRNVEIGTGTDTHNTLYIRSDNPFVVGDNDETSTIIENIYNELVGTIIYNLKCENYADYSLDSWDFIEYVLDENTYTTINDNEYTYEMTIMGKVEVDIPNKIVEETTNIVENERTKYNILKTRIDQANNEIDIISGQSDEIQGQVETLSISQAGLTNTFSKMGGNNLWFNSGLHFKNEDGSFTYWNVEPDNTYEITSDTEYQENKNYYSLVNSEYILLVVGTDYAIGDTISGTVYEITSTGYLDVVNDSESLSGTDMVLPYGKISQTITIYDYINPSQYETIPITHINTFSYKKNIANANCYMTINGSRYKLGDETEWTLIDEKIQKLTLTSNALTIEFECDTQGGYYIKELMLNSGNEPLEYSQNINETNTDTVKISDGILVSSSKTNTESRHDSDGFRILKKDTKEVVLRATENGTETKSIIATNDSEIAGLIIKNVNGHTLLSGKGGY